VLISASVNAYLAAAIIRVFQNCVDFSFGQCVFGGCYEYPVTHKMLT
jgi:hypothetical protein